jgi:ABC-type glycerol-3-phosphate transport system substrate-binding protein
MRNSKLRVGLALALVAMVVASCSSSAASPTAAPASGQATAQATAVPTAVPAPVEITFQSDPDVVTPVEFWLDLVNKFNASHPAIHVKFIPSPGAAVRDEYAQTLLQAGSFPDTAWALEPIVFKDALMPLPLDDPEIQQQDNLTQMTIQGKLLNTSPFKETWSSIYYNKSMFTKAGITEEPKTWPEFETVLEKLKASGVVPMVLGGEFLPGFYAAASLSNIFSESNPCWYAQRRSGKAHFTDQNWVDEMTKLRTWTTKGYFLQGGLGNSYVQTGAAFLAGKAAMYPMGDFETGSFKNTPPAFEIGYFATPSSDGKLRMEGPLGGHGYTISKTTKHPAEALVFLKWMSFDPEAVNPLLSVYGLAPMITLKNGKQLSPTYTDLQKEVVADVGKAVEHEIPYYGGGDLCKMPPGMNNEISKAASAVILGQNINDQLKKLDAYWDANDK